MRTKQFNTCVWRTTLASILVVGGSTLSLSGLAATNTGNFGVTATVAASCSVSGTDLEFGTSIDVLGADIDQTSTITATCTNGSPYTIGLNAGLATGATVTDRKMTHANNTNTLNYTIFTDAGRTTNWDDVGGTNFASGTGSGAAQNITVYGRIPTGQTSAIAGSYSDTITATIDF